MHLESYNFRVSSASKRLFAYDEQNEDVYDVSDSPNNTQWCFIGISYDQQFIFLVLWWNTHLWVFFFFGVNCSVLWIYGTFSLSPTKYSLHSLFYGCCCKQMNVERLNVEILVKHLIQSQYKCKQIKLLLELDFNNKTWLNCQNSAKCRTRKSKHDKDMRRCV